MSLLKRFLSSNVTKYEDDQKKRYKKYMKISKKQAKILEKSEAEVYEDYLERQKSIRNSKRQAPAHPSILFKDPSEGITLGPAPAVLEALNSYVLVEGVPKEYLTDLHKFNNYKDQGIKETNTIPEQLENKDEPTTSYDVVIENQNSEAIQTPAVVPRRRKWTGNSGNRNSEEIYQNISIDYRHSLPIEEINTHTIYNDKDIVLRHSNDRSPSRALSLQSDIFYDCETPQEELKQLDTFQSINEETTEDHGTKEEAGGDNQREITEEHTVEPLIALEGNYHSEDIFMSSSDEDTDDLKQSFNKYVMKPKPENKEIKQDVDLHEESTRFTNTKDEINFDDHVQDREEAHNEPRRPSFLITKERIKFDDDDDADVKDKEEPRMLKDKKEPTSPRVLSTKEKIKLYDGVQESEESRRTSFIISKEKIKFDDDDDDGDVKDKGEPGSPSILTTKEKIKLYDGVQERAESRRPSYIITKEKIKFGDDGDVKDKEEARSPRSPIIKEEIKFDDGVQEKEESRRPSFLITKEKIKFGDDGDVKDKEEPRSPRSPIIKEEIKFDDGLQEKEESRRPSFIITKEKIKFDDDDDGDVKDKKEPRSPSIVTPKEKIKLYDGLQEKEELGRTSFIITKEKIKFDDVQDEEGDLNGDDKIHEIQDKLDVLYFNGVANSPTEEKEEGAILDGGIIRRLSNDIDGVKHYEQKPDDDSSSEEDVFAPKKKNDKRKVYFDFANSYCSTYDPIPEDPTTSDTSTTSDEEENYVTISFNGYDNNSYLDFLKKNQVDKEDYHEKDQIFKNFGVTTNSSNSIERQTSVDDTNMDMAVLNCKNGYYDQSRHNEENTEEELDQFSDDCSLDFDVPNNNKFQDYYDNIGEFNGEKSDGGPEEFSLADIQADLDEIKKLDDVVTQIDKFQDILNKIRVQVESLESKDSENYTGLLKTLLGSMKVLGGLDCHFDGELLEFQQQTLSNIRECIDTLNGKKC